MSENVGSIVYEVDANTSGLIDAQRQVEASNSKMQKGFNQTDKAAEGMQKRLNSTTGTTKVLAKNMATAEVGGKKFGNSMRQASMQLSQVAQQGSVTGNYLQALAIQLPDLALGFGTVGIIAGALAGTVGIGLLNAFTGADESIDNLEETLKTLGSTFETVAGESNELSKELKELYNISRSTAELKILIRTEEAKKSIDEINDFMIEALAEGLETNTFLGFAGLEKIISGGASSSQALESVARSAKITTEEITDLAEAASNAKFDKSVESYSALSDVITSLKVKYGDSNDAVNEFSAELSNQIPIAIKAAKTLQKLNELTDNISGGADMSGGKLGEGASDAEGDHMASVIAARQKEAAAVIEQTRKQFQDEQTLADEQLIERLTAIDDAQISIAEKDQAEYEARALHAQKLADLDAKRTTDEQAEAAKRLTLKKMELAAYTQLGGQLTNLVAAAGAENTAIGKAVFLANQALAVAGIIVNTQAAAAATLPLDPTGSLSARVTTLGYTSAAIAAGVGIAQTFSGRQTGGPTEANTPYRVGESGPELFTSGGRQFLIGGEKGNVTPTNQLGGAAAPQVNVVVNNNTSSNVSVSQEQDGNNVTIQMLVADFAEGGPVSRAMSNSYSTKRKTS